MRRLLVVSLLVLAACSERGTEPEPAPAASAADLVLTNARVYTVDPDASWAEAVAIRGDRIVYVGDAAGAAALEGEGTKVVDVGGRVLALASIEYQHPVVRDWYGAAFVDAGNAADRWADWDPVYGIGVGVRWRSPVGPVSVDVAWGEADRRLRFHFSVGYAF